METEIIKGKILGNYGLQYTNNNKALCKAKIETEEETLSAIAWDEEAEKLHTILKDEAIIAKGYRKFSNFSQKEEFTILQIIKKGYENEMS